MRKSIGEDVADGIFEVGAAGEVSAVVDGIAPSAVVVPVPGRHAEFGVVAVSEGTPSGGEGFLKDVRRVDVVDGDAGKNIDGAAKRLVRIEGVEDVMGIHVEVKSGNCVAGSGRMNVGGRLSDDDQGTRAEKCEL